MFQDTFPPAPKTMPANMNGRLPAGTESLQPFASVFRMTADITYTKYRCKPLISILYFSGASGQKRRGIWYNAATSHRLMCIVKYQPNHKDSKYLKTGETRTLFLHCGNNLKRRHLASIFEKQHRTPE